MPSAFRNLAAGMVLTATSAFAETTTIAALGDSLTHGFGLAQEDGFVPQLERWLRERGADVEVLNAGVSGDTTRGGLARAAWTLTPEVDAVIVTLGGNDALRGLDPAMSRSNLAGILEAADEAGAATLLVGMKAPTNYGPDYKRAFDAMYPELAEESGVLFAEDFLAPIVAIADRERARRDYMQPDGIHPNADGVALIVEALGPSVLELIGRID